MADTMKFRRNREELESLINAELARKQMFSGISISIMPIVENSRGENFEIRVVSDERGMEVAIDEARRTVFARILGENTLSL